ncbi:MAG: high-affinity nickel-transport family protein [Gemmatimonadaceae bacterium]
MTNFIALMVLGFFLGMRHATDPDHVIAVTTIVTREKSPSSATLIGAAWGVGHTLTILVVGGGMILFGWVIPPRIGLSMEFSVGIMLVVLGVINLAGVLPRLVRGSSIGGAGARHSHPHSHGDYVHNHVHTHEPDAHPHALDRTPLSRLDRRFGPLGAYKLMRPLIVGVVHGLAGSAAVALIVLATVSNPRWAIWYLLLFGIGTIAGMMVTTAAIVFPFTRNPARLARFEGGLKIASGVVSLAFGLFVAYRIGFGHGLFTASPDWTPQ